MSRENENPESSISVSLSPLEVRSIAALALFWLSASEINPALEKISSAALKNAAEMPHEQVISIFLSSLDLLKKEPSREQS